MKQISRISSAILFSAVILSGCTKNPNTTSEPFETEESTPQSESQQEEPSGQAAKGDENLHPIPVADSSSPTDSSSTLSNPSIQNASRSDQELHSYPVASVLDNAQSLVGSRFIVIGNLPQNAPMDDQGHPMLFLLGDTENIRLRLNGEVGIGSCKAALTGTLLESEDDGYIFQVESYKQL
ncbi:hypothetical protein [Allobaculum sp. JKK-2023]|uniref:hypothetical protein n=1 Tax=Allobaculum sp. JKK-2023 TaxID=3108943 RepID=UPI002B05D16F|nr:hypothetical protein [Allobaculum sp. JKK-2023]